MKIIMLGIPNYIFKFIIYFKCFFVIGVLFFSSYGNHHKLTCKYVIKLGVSLSMWADWNQKNYNEWLLLNFFFF